MTRQDDITLVVTNDAAALRDPAMIQRLPCAQTRDPEFDTRFYIHAKARAAFISDLPSLDDHLNAAMKLTKGLSR